MNADDKKGLWIVGVLLVIIVGFLIGIRGCDKKELQDDQKNPEIKEPTPSKTPEVTPKIENPDSSTISTNQAVIKTVVAKKDETKKETIDLNSYLLEIASDYQVEVGDSSFKLPEVKQENGISVEVEYYWRGLYESSYHKVSNFNSEQLGIYKVVYTVSYRNHSLQKETFIEIRDTEAPTIEGIIEMYDSTNGTTSYEPVKSGSRINKTIQISFRDNYEVSYAEYYKAKYEVINGTDTIEQEGMQEIINIDLEQGLILYEDGEYHIRAYDISGNVNEYIVTIDRTNPSVKVLYSRIDKDHTMVIIESQEPLQEMNGWNLSENRLSLTKVYANSQAEAVTVFDLAGNKVTVNVATTNVEASFVIQQANKETTSINLNTNDGDIIVYLHSNPTMEFKYALEDGQFQTYNNEILNREGHYTFIAVLDGKIMDQLELDVSNQTVGD